mgnify:CR=1 FL=1
MTKPRYKDPNISIQERVDDLLSVMTFDEKLAQITAMWLNVKDFFDIEKGFDYKDCEISLCISEQSSEKVKVVSTKNSAESVAQKQKNIESAVAEMNEYIQSTQRDIEFYVDDALGKTIVSVLDRESQEVIRQIPDEKFLKMARLLKEDIAAGTDDPLHLISARA